MSALDAKPRVLLLLLAVVLASSSISCTEDGTPDVAKRGVPTEVFFGAAAGPLGRWYVLLDREVVAFTSRGEELWHASAPWYKHPRQDEVRRKKLELVLTHPSFFRPPPVPLGEGRVAVLSCVKRRLVLQVHNARGRAVARIRPLPHNMLLQQGLLRLFKFGDLLLFGYKLSTREQKQNPDRGIIAYDLDLKEQWRLPHWGDDLVCSDDGYCYAPVGEPRRDAVWARLRQDGTTAQLPEAVARHWQVAGAGSGGELILWGSIEDSTGKRPDGNLDSKGSRYVWRPDEESPAHLRTDWRSWQGQVVPCPGDRYMLRIWPNSRQEFLCLARDGTELWRYRLRGACRIWPPEPVHDREGNIYLVDTVKVAEGPDAVMVLLRFSPDGVENRRVPIMEVSGRAGCSTYISDDGHLLVVGGRSPAGDLLLTFVGPED